MTIKIYDTKGELKEFEPVETNEDLAKLLGATDIGDMFYYDGSQIIRLPIGTMAQTLKVNAAGTAPEWV